MSNLVNRKVLSKLKAFVTQYGKSVDMEKLPYTYVRSVQVKTDQGMFDFQTRETLITVTETKFAIWLSDIHYILFINTKGEFLSNEEDIEELYNKEMNYNVDIVDQSIPEDEKADFLSAARSLFKTRDGILTKKAL